MRKDLNILYTRSQIQEAINNLDKNKIHILYFSYKLNLHNLYKGPLLIFTKIYNFLKGTPSIDHVTHISRFIFDQDENNWIAKVFEATIERGMEENDLFDKLKQFQGTCYIETIDQLVDKQKAKAFENKYVGVPYSKELAAFSGLDLTKLDKKISSKTNGGFCSWLESLFLIDQGFNISNIDNGNPYEITPTDIYKADLGNKSILFKS